MADVRRDGGCAHHDQSTEEVDLNLRFPIAPSGCKGYNYSTPEFQKWWGGPIVFRGLVDAKHYKVEFENESVRVLRISRIQATRGLN